MRRGLRLRVRKHLGAGHRRCRARGHHRDRRTPTRNGRSRRRGRRRWRARGCRRAWRGTRGLRCSRGRKRRLRDRGRGDDQFCRNGLQWRYPRRFEQRPVASATVVVEQRAPGAARTADESDIGLLGSHAASLPMRRRVSEGMARIIGCTRSASPRRRSPSCSRGGRRSCPCTCRLELRRNRASRRAR